MEALASAIEKLFFECDSQMKFEMSKDPSKVKLMMPDFAIRFFEEGLHELHRAVPIPKDGIKKFMGVEIVTGYECEIILFHSDYPLYKYEWMINKLRLSDFVSIKSNEQITSNV
jgi:hypothetical protein